MFCSVYQRRSAPASHQVLEANSKTMPKIMGAELLRQPSSRLQMASLACAELDGPPRLLGHFTRQSGQAGP